MELYEGIDIGDNVEYLKFCPLCKTSLHDFHNHVSVPNKKKNTKDVFYTWSCFLCKKEFISYQEKRDCQNGETLAQP